MCVCGSVCVLWSRWWSWPTANNLCLFYGLLPSCSVWAINLSPAISKQCSNQWQIISTNRWSGLFFFSLSLSLCYLCRCRPMCTSSLLVSSHFFSSSSLVSRFCCLCFFLPLLHTSPFFLSLHFLRRSWLRSTYLKGGSLAAPQPLSTVVFTCGIFNDSGFTSWRYEFVLLLVLYDVVLGSHWLVVHSSLFSSALLEDIF